jgi:hypothetical protein
VAKISPIVGAKVNAGSVLSEGVAALHVDRVQAQLRVTGRKVRIGVISDGIESIAAPTATGDIPATSTGLPKVELCPLNDNGGDEGTAMLEIVHDVAPGAALAFCPAFGDSGQQGLADAVTLARHAGVRRQGRRRHRRRRRLPDRAVLPGRRDRAGRRRRRGPPRLLLLVGR